MILNVSDKIMAISRFCRTSANPEFMVENGHFTASINYFSLLDFVVNIDTGMVSLYEDDILLFGPTDSIEKSFMFVKSAKDF